MTLNYDQETDTLYIVLEHSSKACDYVEEAPGIVLRIDPDSNRVVGCTILSFLARGLENQAIEVAGCGHGIPVASDLPEHVGG